MFILLAFLGICVLLAWLSDQRAAEAQKKMRKYNMWADPFFITLVIFLVIFSGFRTDYNDTWNYISAFRKAPGIQAYFTGAASVELMKNPLFVLYQSFLRTFTDDAQVLIFTTSLFTQVCFAQFVRRCSSNFAFGIFLYFTVGTFCFSLAAMKQVAAMAVWTLAFPFLEKKKWVPYYLLVFIAMLVHTYAIFYAMLPFFTRKPWKMFTLIFVLSMVVIMMNFEEAITAFMGQAEEAGKKLSADEIFDENTVNILRVAVYAITPLFSFVFRKWILADSTPTDHILIHMSIISLAFICMGTQSGANVFARMSTYFELGTVCCLPGMLSKTFSERSMRLVFGAAAVCFLFFFMYDNNGFDRSFSHLLW